jgi:hypothetical protein
MIEFKCRNITELWSLKFPRNIHALKLNILENIENTILGYPKRL